MLRKIPTTITCRYRRDGSIKEVTVAQIAILVRFERKFIEKYHIKDSFRIEHDDEEISNIDFAEDVRTDGQEIVYYQT
jgi:hypothetical protein